MLRTLKITGTLIILTLLATANGQAQEEGIGTYYADKYHGKPTTSGEIYNMNDFTAAHKTLEFGTRVRVTRLDNGRNVIVRINDRGPFRPGRIIDLSKAAAAQLNMLRAGEVRVRVDIVERGNDVGVLPATTSVNPDRDLSGLPLRDFSGRLIEDEGGSSSEVITDLGEESYTNDYAEDGYQMETLPSDVVVAPSESVERQSEETASSESVVEETAMQKELQKYTPALFSFVASKREAVGFGVQVGAYFSFYRLLEAMDGLYKKGYQNTMVQNSVKNGKPVFRVIVGPYESRNQANQAKRLLSNQRIKGIVVDLAGLN